MVNVLSAEKKVQDHFIGRPNLQQERLMKMMMSIKTSITQYFLSAKHSTKYQWDIISFKFPKQELLILYPPYRLKNTPEV